MVVPGSTSIVILSMVTFISCNFQIINYQMLEWCLANYRTDRVLQQSAGGTLHRLQTTLSNDEDLRLRFTASLQLQDQFNLENAHLEALRLHERQELLESEPNEDAV